jgi:hypothetical protein
VTVLNKGCGIDRLTKPPSAAASHCPHYKYKCAQYAWKMPHLFTSVI